MGQLGLDVAVAVAVDDDDDERIFDNSQPGENVMGYFDAPKTTWESLRGLDYKTCLRKCSVIMAGLICSIQFLFDLKLT